MIIIPEQLEIHKPNKKLEEKINSIEIKEKVLFQKESDFHNIFVVENSFGRFLKYQETYQAGFIKTKEYSGNLPYINYFLIPYLMNKNIKNVLLVGFGSGIIINQFEKLFKNLKSIDIVDIEENIFPIAQKYFDFQISDKMEFYLQDALIFLKTTKRKYDLIIVDVAGDEGIDERFLEDEYFSLIQKRLKKGGIFVSNLPSSRDIFNKKNKLILDLLKRQKKYFQNIKMFNGETSNKIYYKTFFDIDEPVFDITNLILILSEKDYSINQNINEIEEIVPNFNEFLGDLVSF